MDDGVAVKVDHVSKKFCRALRRSMTYGLADLSRNVFGISARPDRLRKDEFWAVNDVSFEVKQGETVGIIGANGSGKTTMLSMLNGIIWPDKGSIQIRGRTGALIAVGAGFHPMLSGRENIYVQGGILGLSREQIDEKFDNIVEFADIGEFISAPVKFYSSGMVVRLGFAIAINIEPEVLLIDEVLSVGDLNFQNKSLRRVAELRQKANAVVFVSHNLLHVQYICDRVIILEAGRVAFSGPTEDAILEYHEMTRQRTLSLARKEQPLEMLRKASSGDVEFLDAGVIDGSGQKTAKLQMGDDITFFFDFDLLQDIVKPDFMISIRDEAGRALVVQRSNDGGARFDLASQGRHRLTVRFRCPNLAPGVYTPSFALRNGVTAEIYEKSVRFAAFSVEAEAITRGLVYAESEWHILSLEDTEDGSKESVG